MPEFPVVHGSASSVSRRDYSKPNVALKESDKFKALNEIKVQVLIHNKLIMSIAEETRH